MPRVRIRFLLVACLFVAQWASLAPQCQAGPLLNWLRARRAHYAGVAYPYPWAHTAYYYPAARTTYFGGVFAPASQSATVSYMPVTSYRTSWFRVPVTYYRPVASVDPATGSGVTCMRACNSFTWRVQRVPYTTYRVVYAPVACDPCNTCGTACGTTIVGQSGCSSCTTTQPYYTPSTTVTPAPAAGGAADTAPVLQPSEAQGASLSLPLRDVPISSEPTSKPASDAVFPNITPVPDPDANEAPRLLNPRDRTASYSRVTRVVPASAVAQEEWDDSGWKSIQP